MTVGPFQSTDPTSDGDAGSCKAPREPLFLKCKDPSASALDFIPEGVWLNVASFCDQKTHALALPVVCRSFYRLGWDKWVSLDVSASQSHPSL